MTDQFEFEQESSKSSGALDSARSLLYKIPRKARIVGSIILFGSFIIVLLNVLKPEAKKRPVPETVVSVETIQAVRSTYPIVVNANGTVEAQTRGNLVAQVRGEIVAIGENFKTGGAFKKGEMLVQVDRRDYQADLSQSLAQLSQAEAAYRQEQANAKQAAQDWKRLGNTNPAPDLVLRKPQLTASKAQRDSARASHQTAQLNLSRTTITAPYDGRVISRAAVLGQYIGIGNPIAEVFATEGVEVRLPISQDEFNQLGLDQLSNENAASNFSALISADIGTKTYQWDAKITRSDSTFDVNTRQIDIIAEVKDPFGKESGRPALKIGQFVNARIQGVNVDNVFVIPNKSIREGRYVYLVRDELLAKQNIDILGQDDQNALVSNGLSDNDQVVTTSLNSTLAGARAKLANKNIAAPASSPAIKPVIEPAVTETAATDENVNSAESGADKPSLFDEQALVEQALSEPNADNTSVQESAVQKTDSVIQTIAENVDANAAQPENIANDKNSQLKEPDSVRQN